MSKSLLCLVGLLAILAFSSASPRGTTRLVCYYDEPSYSSDGKLCTHVVYTGAAKEDKLDAVLKKFKELYPRVKLILRTTDVEKKNISGLLKSSSINGIEISDAHRSLNRTKVTSLVEEARSAITSGGGGALFLALPAHPELLAKYYDLRSLAKSADLMVAQTHSLGVVKKQTFHPSRLSGLWDMMNTDSVVDLIVGLGVPPGKLIVSLPATAYEFRLTNESLSTPGSPAEQDQPQELNQEQLCKLISSGGKWTLERDQDLSSPYAFKNSTWVAFEDASSADVKGKYARVRGLGGLALAHAQHDASTTCSPALLIALDKALNAQSRAPRGLLLRNLESEILSPSSSARVLDALQVSPYRITQVVDADGVIHAIREDTRTEFTCSRQGYFVHPRSCGRFYRCVKFDQLSPDYTVFEFDCPAGLAFDSRWEVCVWPGSISDASACPGSSEIAPVPRTRFICPEATGYYADPENCRWFFACLDHGKAPLSAYEFRCPFGLGFDASRLLCDWPWLVPGCGDIARYEAEAFGYSGAKLTGAAAFIGQTADSVNMAAHKSLISGASTSNLLGIQSGYGNDESLDGHYSVAQNIDNGEEYDSEGRYISGYFNGGNYGGKSSQNVLNAGAQVNAGLLDLTETHLEQGDNNEGQFYSGRFNNGYNAENINLGQLEVNSPNAAVYGHAVVNAQNGAFQASDAVVNAHNTAYSSSSSHSNAGYAKSAYNTEYADKSGAYRHDDSGSYVHDKTGDYFEAYKHVDAAAAAYIHDDGGSYASQYSGNYKYDQQNDNNNYNLNAATGYVTKFENDGAYKYSQGFSQLDSNKAHLGYTGHADTGLYAAGEKQRISYGYGGEYNSALNADYSGSYKADLSGAYHHDESGKYVAGIYRDGYTKTDFSGGNGQHNTLHAIDITDSEDGKAALYKSGVGAVSHSSLNQVHSNDYNANTAYQGYSKSYLDHSQAVNAGAINVDLVGKTAHLDTEVFDKNVYNRPHGAISTSSRHQVLNSNNAYNYNAGVKSESTGYVYDKPTIAFEDGRDHIESVTVAPYVGSTYTYTSAPIASSTPAPLAQVTYKSVVPVPAKTHITEVFGYQKPEVTYVQPFTVTEAPQGQYLQPNIQLTTYNKPSISSQQFVQYHSQPRPVLSTPAPFKAELSGYEYLKPAISFEETPFQKISTTPAPPKVVVTYSTPRPSPTVYVQPEKSTYKYDREYVEPAVSVQSIQNNSQTEKVYTATEAPYKQVELSGYNYPRPAVSFYENPLQKYIQPIAPVTATPAIAYAQPSVQPYFTPTPKTVVPQVVPTYQPVVQKEIVRPIIQHTYVEQPVVQQHYIQPVVQQQYIQPVVQQQYIQKVVQPEYVQPVVQREHVQQPVVQNTYEHKPSVQTHIVYHHQTQNAQTDNENYEDAYNYNYQAPSYNYRAEEYLPPKTEHVQPEITVSPTPATVVKNSQDAYVQLPQTQKVVSSYEYQAPSYSLPYEEAKLSPITYNYNQNSNANQAARVVESFHISSDQGYDYKPAVTTLQPVIYKTVFTPKAESYETPSYLPPSVASTYLPPSVASTYLPPSVAPTYKADEYLPPKVEVKYVSTTASPKPEIKYSYLPPSVAPTYKADEYLTPKTEVKYVSTTAAPTPEVTYRTTYTTAAPITSTYKAPEYLPPLEEEHDSQVYYNYDSSKDENQSGNFGFKSLKTVFSTPAPVTYKINPIEEYAVRKIPITPVPSVYRKQNIVVQTAKAQSNLLGFGTVGPDAGLIAAPEYSSTYSAPVTSPITQKYIPAKQIVTTTYAPPATPIRRTKPKVAVVTKINDFNPLLVRKLGVVCSCVSPVLRLRGKQADSKPDYETDYGNDYESVSDYSDSEWAQKSNIPAKQRYTSSEYLPAKENVYSSTFEPIIVPDDLHYNEEYPDTNSNVKSTIAPTVVKENLNYPIEFISSTTEAPSTRNIVRINPRVKSATQAPTLASVLVSENVTPSVIVQTGSSTSLGLSHSFDRYGPGGWRSRDETLQGSIDCKRAGLFRHPKHCNKFYACRWDCTKERFTLHVFNCPVQLSFDPNMGACNWPSQGPACQGDTLLPTGM